MALVLAPEPPLAEWLAALDAQIAAVALVLRRPPVIVDLAGLPREQPDVAGLIHALRARGIRIIGTEGAHPSWQGVEKWGPPLSGSRPAPSRRAARRGPGDRPPHRRRPRHRSRNSLVIEHSVRSGQSVVFEKGDVTIIGSVASGAEIIAGGSIHVYGALRGRAVAGSPAIARARIFCRKLEAELLAIDGVYQTADDMEHGAARPSRCRPGWTARP